MTRRSARHVNGDSESAGLEVLPRLDSGGRLSRRRRLLLGGAVSLAALLLLDALLGALLIRDGRFRGRPVPPYALTFNDLQRRHLAGMRERWDPYTQFDPLLGWSIRPEGVSDDGKYRANRAGLRADREYPLQPSEGVIRVAAFGDSFTHGATSNEGTWCAQMESLDARLEVLNFGVNGYGPDQAFLRYQRDGAAFRPRIVLIGLMVENVMRSVSVYRPAYHHETNSVVVKPRFALNGEGVLERIPLPVGDAAELQASVRSGAILESLRRTDYWVRRAPLAYDRSPLLWPATVRLLLSTWENADRDPCIHYQDADGEPYRVTLAIMKTFSREAVSNGAERAIVLFFPDAATLFSLAQGQGSCWDAFLADLRAAGVECLDLTDDLMDGLNASGPGAIFSESHYSAAGNAIVARAVCRFLGE